MASSITLTFNSIPAEGTKIVIRDSLTGNLDLTETFKASRTQKGESQNNQSGTVNETAFYYKGAFIADYNVTSLYSLVSNTPAGTVVITANNPNSSFTVTENTTSGAVTTSIDNVSPPVDFGIDSIGVSQSNVNTCENVKLTIETSEQAEWILSPVSQSVNTNPLVIDVPRTETITVTMSLDGVNRSQTISIPRLLASYFELDIVNTPSNASLRVNSRYLFSPVFSLTYSLDDTTYQSSNYFPGLSDGDYTVYVKDSLGCTISIDFTVDEFVANVVDYDAICEISNLNPIRYKLNETWGSSVLKTPENTLSFEENVKFPNRTFTQPFTKTDTPITQIKTNYSDVSAKIIDNQGNETSLLVSKRTANMNITDVRDAVVLGTTYNNQNYVSVKFSGGNTYDPVTLADNGDYNMGESVPEWINKDDYLYIQGIGWYKVLDIVYNTNAYVVVVNLLFADFPLSIGTTGNFVVSTVYNVLDFERYEFVPNLATLEGYYKIQIDITDSTFGNKSFLSEWLNIRDEHPNTKLIQYYNSENNEINYNTGFIGQIRIPLADDLKWKASTEQDIYVTDTNTVNLESKYRGFWDFKSRLLPTMMAEKLAMILIQDRLFIDTVNYLADGDIESKPIGSQYQIIANLVKSNYVFDSNSGLSIGEVTLQGVPLAISPSGGFLLVE